MKIEVSFSPESIKILESLLIALEQGSLQINNPIVSDTLKAYADEVMLMAKAQGLQLAHDNDEIDEDADSMTYG